MARVDFIGRFGGESDDKSEGGKKEKEPEKGGEKEKCEDVKRDMDSYKLHTCHYPHTSLSFQLSAHHSVRVFYRSHL